MFGDKVLVVILAGGNLGDTKDYLNQALQQCAGALGPCVLKSSVYQSEPWGFDSPQHFLNQVWVFETELSASACLKKMLEIEQSLGRIRGESEGYSSRTIDLDILYYGQEVINEDHLHVPHPRINQRRFALMPLCEVLPNFIHPVLGKNNQQILADCTDTGLVERLP